MTAAALERHPVDDLSDDDVYIFGLACLRKLDPDVLRAVVRRVPADYMASVMARAAEADRRYREAREAVEPSEPPVPEWLRVNTALFEAAIAEGWRLRAVDAVNAVHGDIRTIADDGNEPTDDDGRACILIRQTQPDHDAEIAGVGATWRAAYRDAIAFDVKLFLRGSAKELANAFGEPPDVAEHLRGELGELKRLMLVGPGALALARRVVT